ncbi:unnamed protein product [Blepharisma stoltei]|uniref:Major facilitator superfamily (MFS) profile domain-containing protein n=1 Tax=Blepharisma stoltei TaxID=1481888 RepID=A0AAU9J886_9CILI|nr:unnamed protein product [Blepharisma stoltei]
MIMTGINSLAYGALFTIPPEVYPTEVRNSAQGLFFASSRIGGVSAPLIAGVLIDLDGGQVMCLMCFGIAYFLAGICALFLKETRSELDDDNLISS